MTPEEHEQKRSEFEATIAELPDEEKTAKLSEWETANPVKPKEGEGSDDYRGKLNAQNRFLENEGYKFEGGKWVKPATAAAEPSVSLSAQDIIALRDVHEEDIGTIQDWAKFKGVSLAEARKDKDLNTILSARSEERTTAAATHTAGGSRGAKKPTGEELLAKARRTNELPQDDEGMAAIAAARQPRPK